MGTTSEPLSTSGTSALLTKKSTEALLPTVVDPPKDPAASVSLSAKHRALAKAGQLPTCPKGQCLTNKCPQRAAQSKPKSQWLGEWVSAKTQKVKLSHTGLEVFESPGFLQGGGPAVATALHLALRETGGSCFFLSVYVCHNSSPSHC